MGSPPTCMECDGETWSAAGTADSQAGCVRKYAGQNTS